MPSDPMKGTNVRESGVIPSGSNVRETGTSVRQCSPASAPTPPATRDEIEESLRICEAAPPEPWEATDWKDRPVDAIGVCCPKHEVFLIRPGECGCDDGQTAVFIAHARTALPLRNRQLLAAMEDENECLDEIERLNRRIMSLEAENARLEKANTIEGWESNKQLRRRNDALEFLFRDFPPAHTTGCPAVTLRPTEFGDWQYGDCNCGLTARLKELAAGERQGNQGLEE